MISVRIRRPWGRVCDDFEDIFSGRFQTTPLGTIILHVSLSLSVGIVDVTFDCAFPKQDVTILSDVLARMLKTRGKHHFPQFCL